MNNRFNLSVTAFFTSVCLLSACSTAPKVSDTLDLDAGAAAYKAELYADAYEILLPQAELDDADANAQYAVGYLLFYGKGVAQDKAAAMEWFAKAAANGSQKATDALSILSDKNEQSGAAE